MRKIKDCLKENVSELTPLEPNSITLKLSGMARVYYCIPYWIYEDCICGDDDVDYESLDDTLGLKKVLVFTNLETVEFDGVKLNADVSGFRRGLNTSFFTELYSTHHYYVAVGKHERYTTVTYDIDLYDSNCLDFSKLVLYSPDTDKLNFIEDDNALIGTTLIYDGEEFDGRYAQFDMIEDLKENAWIEFNEVYNYIDMFDCQEFMGGCTRTELEAKERIKEAYKEFIDGRVIPINTLEEMCILWTIMLSVSYMKIDSDRCMRQLYNDNYNTLEYKRLVDNVNKIYPCLMNAISMVNRLIRGERLEYFDRIFVESVIMQLIKSEYVIKFYQNDEQDETNCKYYANPDIIEDIEKVTLFLLDNL